MLQFSNNVISKVNSIVDTITKSIKGGQYIYVNDILQNADAYIYFYDLSSIFDGETIIFPSTDFFTEKNQEVTLYDEGFNYEVTIKYDYENKKITFTSVKSMDGDFSSQLDGKVDYVTKTYDIDFSKTKIWLQSKSKQKNMVVDGNNNLFSVHDESYILLKGSCIFEEL